MYHVLELLGVPYSKTCPRKTLELSEAAVPIEPAPGASKSSPLPQRASSSNPAPSGQTTSQAGNPNCVAPTALQLSPTDPLLPSVSLEKSFSSTIHKLQPGPPGPRPVHERIPPLPLENALAEARRRVLEAEQAVAQAGTADQYESATLALDRTVLALEKVVLCAQRCAAAVRVYNGI
jgi:hypothetical protein